VIRSKKAPNRRSFVQPDEISRYRLVSGSPHWASWR
jgi:hypothetical protein